MYLVDGLSQRQIAQKLGISRNTVAKYCEGNTYPGLRASYCCAAHCRKLRGNPREAFVPLAFAPGGAMQID